MGHGLGGSDGARKARLDREEGGSVKEGVQKRKKNLKVVPTWERGGRMGKKIAEQIHIFKRRWESFV